MSELIDVASDAKALLDRIEQIARDHEPCERCHPPHDGKPRLRPHSIPGWWQVWSGGICISLLTPEDVAPVTEELMGRLRNAESALLARVRSSPSKGGDK